MEVNEFIYVLVMFVSRGARIQSRTCKDTPSGHFNHGEVYTLRMHIHYIRLYMSLHIECLDIGTTRFKGGKTTCWLCNANMFEVEDVTKQTTNATDAEIV